MEQAFWFLAGLVALTFPLMFCVNIERGKAEAIQLAKVLETKKAYAEDDELSREERTLLVDSYS